MTILVRLPRIALVTILCIVAFAALFEFLNAIPTHLSLPDHPQGGVTNPRGPLVFDALVWGVVFRAPGYLFNGTIPLLIVLAVTEWKSAKSWRWYLTIWIIAGLLATGFPITDPLRLSAALLASAATGYLYWLLAGKSAGDWLQAWGTREPNAGRKLLNYAAYVVLAYLGYQLSGYLYYGGKLLWVSSGPEPDPGTPPFRVRFEREMTASKKVAMMDFPDPASCLKKAETDDLSTDRLKEMDWDRIDNTDEAEVCVFRLLGSFENLSYATDWFEAQGFYVHPNFSSARPYVELDGTLRVTGVHSIRKDGPKFPTTGIIRRAFRSIPYSMSVDATWSKDGKQLLWVLTGFSTL
ncbi:hypothetical protein HFN72_36090 [Rhizobium laguerreae]|uniref:hypothetical protein n=1 Tax=Rhizobium laguerreae TaxID=1076926 RepID=UPI001C91C884|nr:hypothetical protein [Rhizobium laguerreae]MBY3249882.1 hypothetical protein [Rhizobium laguerreae]MBY3531264.1 hypothetical protein [Rhizobium laguerreae]